VSEPDALTAAFSEVDSRFVVGIDLGTTNSALAYCDTQAAQPEVQVFPVEQWVDFASREFRDVLPSFHYEPTADQRQALTAIAGQPVEFVVGALARDSGASQPGRQIASAKSWLCHDGVDRQAALLPWQSDDNVTRLSPVEASARYLAHLRSAWDARFPAAPLAEQDVVLTLPASFDEVARQLTVAAARLAGLPRVLLIEEPQAAFYWWLQQHRDSWESIVRAGQTILVIDIGGGTSDFTLIRVRSQAERDDAGGTSQETLHARDRQRLSLHRVAVGEHLILGGDNLDLALARFVEERLPAGEKISARSWDALRTAARTAKEQVLGDAPPERYSIPVLAGGSKLVAGQRRVECAASELQSVVLDGFFPHVAFRERPVQHRSGFQEFGLPYASEPAISKHLAAFLWDHRHAGRDEQLEDVAAAKPDWILFNGGVMASPQIRQRLLDVIAAWFAGSTADTPADWRPGVLDNPRLDLAVASGAAYFGLVRRGQGVRIEAKLARSYYLVIEDQPPRAVCLIGGAASPGDKIRIDNLPLELAVGEPVQFPIVFSSTRLADRPGELVEVSAEEFSSLPPIRTVLQVPGRRRSDRMSVVLEAELTELGTLQLWCAAEAGQQRWQLEFDVRSTTQTDRASLQITGAAAGVLEESLRQRAREILERAFGPESPKSCPDVVRELTAALELGKTQWPPSLLRAMWQDLLELEAGRRRSPSHEARWLNLLGYCLRPGFGMAADDWRVTQTWRTVYGKLAFATASSRSESLILWRRVAGGFTAGQQLAVYQQVAGPLRATLDPARRSKGGAAQLQPSELIELLRLVGALELLPKEEKQALGGWLLDLLDVKRWQPARLAMLWTLGRLGNRVPTYGPLNAVVDVGEVTRWLERLLRAGDGSGAWHLALLLCARKTGDRYRDIDSSLRGSVVTALAAAPPHYRQLVAEGAQLEQEESAEIVGETLPLGLRVRSQ
jgi:molecular chaperone DnaK (HSP70)